MGFNLKEIFSFFKSSPPTSGRGADLLSVTAGENPYYSGLKIKEVADHIPGVVTLKRAPAPDAALVNILTEFNADNATNRALVSIMTEQGADFPAYVKSVDDGGVAAVSNERLLTYARTALKESFQSQEFKSFSPQLAATTVLAALGGVLLALKKRNSSWTVSTPYPELSARALLHSIPSHGIDYNAEQRQLIRRALIYGVQKEKREALPMDISADELSLIDAVSSLRSKGGA
jgi:hypothetical protein